ncbi:MAG: hypothetical protein KKE94_07660, partial [Gammaproteobacteria bacterium]|nr:hypothetical protein [Gammaproteobacteria bacterium]
LLGNSIQRGAILMPAPGTVNTLAAGFLSKRFTCTLFRQSAVFSSNVKMPDKVILLDGYT